MRFIVLLIILHISLFSITVEQVWHDYKDRFIEDSGRIRDPHNHNITHTEAIGYTLYFAYKMNDNKTFRKVFDWGRDNIKLNRYELPGWKWGENSKKNCWCMLDMTSATDANLWIAYSLLLMYEKTGDDEYHTLADEIISAIKKHQIVYAKNNMPYLLPYEKELIADDEWKLNPSYLIFEIFEYFYKYDRDEVWKKLLDSSKMVIKRARFSALSLNPDWVIYEPYSNKFKLDPKYQNFGFDAIRVPLYILRSHFSVKEKKELLLPYKYYINMMKTQPLGSVKLKDGEISIYDLSFGHLAIYKYLARFYGYDSSLFNKKLQYRIRQYNEDYYSYSLYLLTVLR